MIMRKSHFNVSGLREKADPRCYYVCRGNTDIDYLFMFHYMHSALEFARCSSSREIISYSQMLDLYYNSNPLHAICLVNFYV